MEYFQKVVDFFNHPIFIIIGGITVLSAAIAILYRILCIILGVTPLVFRIGKALWRRKIGIMGDAESSRILMDCVVDSGVFKKRNIVQINNENIDKAKNISLLLVDWESCGTQIDEIFIARNNQNTAVIIYAKAGSIPQEKMAEIANRTNTLVVNFKGRLLNDILNSLITTSF